MSNQGGPRVLLPARTPFGPPLRIRNVFRMLTRPSLKTSYSRRPAPGLHGGPRLSVRSLNKRLRSQQPARLCIREVSVFANSRRHLLIAISCEVASCAGDQKPHCWANCPEIDVIWPESKWLPSFRRRIWIEAHLVKRKPTMAPHGNLTKSHLIRCQSVSKPIMDRQANEDAAC